jgi:hypothetical protein
MQESSLLIEEMVGATTPELDILISKLVQRENCKLPDLAQNLVIFGCQHMASGSKPLWLRLSKMVNSNSIIGAGLLCDDGKGVYHNAVDKANDWMLSS